MRRSLIPSLVHYWRNNLAVTAGAAVATAILAGALLVGDSVRGSLRDLVLDRLGSIDQVLVAERPFREELAGDLAATLGEGARAAPALVLRGTAAHGASGARAAGVAVVGVDARFPGLYPPHLLGDPADFDFARRPGQLFPSVVLNRSLAGELGAAVGDEVLISFARPGEVPRETVVGRQDAAETLETMRLSVSAVVPDRGPGGFSLALQQTRSLNAFVELGRLQRRVGGSEGGGRANLVALAGAGGDASAALAGALELTDLGLELETADGALLLESRAFVLGDRLAARALETARALGAPALPALTNLAISIRAGGREVPYSTVTALDPPAVPELGALELAGGGAVPRLGDDEVLLNRWTAESLGLPVVDPPPVEVELDYFELGPRDELTTRTARFTLAGVVEMAGLGADRSLTPEFPGIEDAEDISSWRPPFPVDLDRIRPEDEDYWDRWGASPKALVSAATGRRLWRSRFGDTTSIRLAPPPGSTVDELAADLADAFVSGLDPGAAGLALRPLRREGLEAARGATDFAQLFLGLSFFLIASAALLVGLLFRLGTERRAAEIGLLRAVGYRARSVRRRLLAEGALLAAAGGVAGLAGAAGYAWAMIAGLRTWWLPAIGAPVLELHVTPASLAAGWAGAFLVVVATIWWTLRRLGRVAPPRLLAGAVDSSGGATRPRRALPVALAGLAGAAALVVAGLATGSGAAPPLAFGIGAALLVSGIAAFAHLSGSGSGRLGRTPVLGMGARNTGRNRARSVLSVALVAAATFLIVVVAANRGGEEVAVSDRASGAGGFTLVAESDVPIHADVARAAARGELGFEAADAAALDGVEIVPFRLLPGEDVSCLNLYRPQRPRVLGVPREMVARGGFTFQGTIRETDAPWSLLEEELGPGVVPAFGDANSVLWILHLGLGEDVVLEGGSGGEVRLRLVGLLQRSLFQSELLISEESFTRLYPDQTGYAYFLADPPTPRAAAVRDLLEARLGRFGFDATLSAERLAAFRAVENTYLSTFQTLGGLGLLLGTVGLGIVLLRNVLERRSELATLRAFGFRRSTLAWMVLAENAVLLTAGIAIGAVAGAAAAAPHLASGGEGLPVASLAATLAVVFAAGTLSSALAVAGSLKVPLLPALKAER